MNNVIKRADLVNIQISRKDAENLERLLGKLNFYCIGSILTRENAKDLDEQDDIDPVWHSSNRVYGILRGVLGKETA